MTNKIDASKIQVGDEVLVRTKVLGFSDDMKHIFIKNHYFGEDASPACLPISDIQDHIPKPFDWKDVKRGDAFSIGHEKETVWYLSNYPPSLEYAVLTDCKGNVWNDLKKTLKRTPEHDKPEWRD